MRSPYLPTPRLCEFCDKEFSPKNKNQVNCSPECRDKKRNRERTKVARAFRNLL